ncbi:hypothetical protein PHYBLDRAFT_176432 [Phycomyces blakesleeanus NRRL 1555(-)]|uniref:Uncharacterized protein n=1 Tax=Phycomyces blakesleeanus (strain ATCC 8743b / DSM 1359 / FGSC 10004 / NBRC 33097 / NRRL 1555) TaxID=763407 RepID=A0A162SZS6_PHYB8|nr:hypothetical protein PHYBLDRAFT_176432 [Phycomyces blakesleeanus NRRL 1555(-)]OAD65102.1 hypothetical protein PHYBLDRAFT_176432 [Phycomyces blakesleeanus NRRL 1555(-)]|eukprot:XP_018283142.1 hypothetical protein PHYBLDRAFT_176432 [Phycomyces blakesleeanus NRRL 1555(-)]
MEYFSLTRLSFLRLNKRYDDIVGLFINLGPIEYLITSNEVLQKTGSKRRSRKRLNLEDLSDAECKKGFCFTFPEIKRMSAFINLDKILSFRRSETYYIKFRCEFAFALVLYRYAFPRRYCSMERMWGINEKNLACTVNQFSVLLFDIFKHGFEFDSRKFSEENCESFLCCHVCKKRYIPKCNWTYRRHNAEGLSHNYKRGAETHPLSEIPGDCHPRWNHNNDAKIFDQSKTLQRPIAHVDHMQPENDPDLKYALYGDHAYKKLLKMTAERNGILRNPVRNIIVDDLLEYCLAVNKEHGILPIVIAFGIHPTKENVTNDLVESSQIIYERISFKERADETVQLLYSIAKQISVNEVTLEERTIDVLLNMCFHKIRKALELEDVEEPRKRTREYTRRWVCIFGNTRDKVSTYIFVWTFRSTRRSKEKEKGKLLNKH